MSTHDTQETNPPAPPSGGSDGGWNLSRLVTSVSLVCLVGAGLAIFLDAPRSVTTNNDDMVPIAGPDDTDTAPIIDLGDPGLTVELSQGGWVQIAGADGELAQQYRFVHLDPDPEGLETHWLRMREPQVQLFLRGGRMVTLTGDRLDAYAPRRSLEQGKLEGDVVITLYEGFTGASGTVDPTTLEPALVVRTAWATFDNLAGRIECPEAITAKSPTERMAGRNLLVLMNDRDDRIEFLRLAQVDFLAIQERSLRHSETTRRSAKAHPRIRLASMAAAQSTLSTTPPSDATPVDWYRLRLDGDVRVEQEDQAGRRLAIGDTMDVVFSMQSGPLLGPSMVASTSGGLTSSHGMLATASLGAGLLGAADQPEPLAGEIIVTCSGPLTMIPMPDTMSAPPSPDASRLELRGSPVRLLDTSDRIGAIAAQLEYRSETERIDLLGSPEQDVTVVTDDLWLRTSNLWAEMGTGRAGSTDTPGQAQVLAQSPLEIALLNEDAAFIDPDAPATLEEDLSIEWTGGVDVNFEPGGASGQGQMKMVRFQGDVEVRSEDGSIDADTLEMHFQPDDQGQAHPDRMFATGDVRARNEDQTLWANVLTATLEPADKPVPESSAVQPESATTDDPMADARIKDLFAEGDVQVLLADGARAFADVLEGDARQSKVVLKGSNIVIARSDLLIEHGRELFIERTEGKATWPGGGRARLLARPINVTQDQRITRPAVPAPTKEIKRVVTLQATWNDSLLYDANHDNGAGALHLAGKVAVVSQQKSTERASLHGGKLRLEFASIADAPAMPDLTAKPATTDAGIFSGDGRVLSRMIADDAARLERRTWPTKDRLETPEIIYIGGDRITWDERNVQAAVEGNGDFVTRQPTWAAAEGDGPFRGAGTARFTWVNRLDMTRRDDGRFTIDMQGMVEGMWKGAADSEDIATLTADQVQAVTRRDVGTLEEPLTTQQPTPLDFDGDASIESLIAIGRVYLATPTRRADADRLDYNTRTGIARLEGRRGHPVAVVNEGAPLPVRATAMIWNMDPDVDTITLESPRGIGGR